MVERAKTNKNNDLKKNYMKKAQVLILKQF